MLGMKGTRSEGERNVSYFLAVCSLLHTSKVRILLLPASYTDLDVGRNEWVMNSGCEKT
jgi:hypothetical protein